MQSKQLTNASDLSWNNFVFRGLMVVIMLAAFLLVHALFLHWLPQAVSNISQSN
jgi:hypothetical protein